MSPSFLRLLLSHQHEKQLIPSDTHTQGNRSRSVCSLEREGRQVGDGDGANVVRVDDVLE